MKLGYVVYWVKSAESSAKFYENVFGLKRQREMQTPLSPWIEMASGETALAFAEFSEADVLFDHKYRKHDPNEAVIASVISFITPDVKQLYEQAIQHGATAITEPRTEPWGQTIARFRDPNGIAVSIATPIQQN